MKLANDMWNVEDTITAFDAAFDVLVETALPSPPSDREALGEGSAPDYEKPVAVKTRETNMTEKTLLLMKSVQQGYWDQASLTRFDGLVLIEVWKLGTINEHDAEKNRIKGEIKQLQERLQELERRG